MAQETEPHLSINDDAAAAFRVALGSGQRSRDGVRDHRVGAKAYGPRTGCETREQRRGRDRMHERAQPLS